MELLYHPSVQKDLHEILRWYDQQSSSAGDRFFMEFEAMIESILQDPNQGIQIDTHTRKALLKKFPYSVTFEIAEDTVFVFVVKHQRRHPNLGMRRRRPSTTG